VDEEEEETYSNIYDNDREDGDDGIFDCQFDIDVIM
jgi:hypothetical protein